MDNKPKVVVLENLGVSNYPSSANMAAKELESKLTEMWDQGYSYSGLVTRHLDGMSNPPRYFLVFNPVVTPQVTSKVSRSSKPSE